MALTIEELEARLKANPFAREFYELAAAYQKLGRLDEAKKLCERGLEKYPGNFQARLLLIQILIAEGKFKEARQNVDRVLMVVPDNITANHLEGDVSFSLGDHLSALRYYRVVELFEPGRSDVVEKIAAIESASAQATGPAGPAQPLQQPGPEEQSSQAMPDTGLAEEPPPDESPKVQEIPAEEKPATEAAEEPEVSLEAADDGTFPEGSVQGEEESSAAAFEESESTSEERPVQDEIGSDTLDSILSETTTAEEAEEKESGPAGPIHEDDGPSSGEEMNSVVSGSAGGELLAEELEKNTHAEQDESAGLNTMTIAELYERQGYPEKAIEVYQHILLKEPERKDIRTKIEKLKDRMMGLEPEGGEVLGRDVKSALRRKRIEVLGTWLRKIKEEGNV